MGRWEHFIWPRGIPLWLVLAGHSCLTLVVLGLSLVLLPRSLADKLPKWMRLSRKRLANSLRWAMKISAKGPLGWFLLFLCRRCSCGRCASRCRAPKALRLKALGCNEVQGTFQPELPANPFHEEFYIMSWSPAGAGDEWAEYDVNHLGGCEEVGGRRRVVVKKLPEGTSLRLRVCSLNNWGRSPWSAETLVETLAKPSALGGFHGPLQGTDARYIWTQAGAEVALRLPIGPSRKAKDFKFKWTPTRLEIRRVDLPESDPDGEVLLGGPLPKKIKCDEVFWSIDEDEAHGRHIHLQMAKVELMEKWPCLIDAPGHPRVDTSFIGQFKEALRGVQALDIWE